jgi:hypothetical protein
MLVRCRRMPAHWHSVRGLGSSAPAPAVRTGPPPASAALLSRKYKSALSSDGACAARSAVSCAAAAPSQEPERRESLPRLQPYIQPSASAMPHRAPPSPPAPVAMVASLPIAGLGPTAPSHARACRVRAWLGARAGGHAISYGNATAPHAGPPAAARRPGGSGAERRAGQATSGEVRLRGERFRFS